ncbi:hypothetical protein OKZ62_001860 [Vibrio navarrensis]|nr:hypothetical protein [Vibrio navarrensis]
MEILAKKKILVPHWHVPLLTVICLFAGLWAGFTWVTGIGIFYAGLHCSIFLPVWKNVNSENDIRYLTYASEARGVTFWYWILPISGVTLAILAVIAKLFMPEIMTP